MVYVKSSENESGEATLRRFKRRVQQSGIMLQARKRRFRQPKKNKRKIREDAKRKRRVTAERNLLRKLGKLPSRDW